MTPAATHTPTRDLADPNGRSFRQQHDVVAEMLD